MKRKIFVALVLLLCCLAVGAQRVDPVLSQLLKENAQTVALGKAKRLKRIVPNTVNGVDTLEIQTRLNVHFNADGSLRMLCILGTLADNAVCPEEALQELGIKTVCTVGRLVIMDVPATSFSALSEMKEFRWLAPDRVYQLDNVQARETNTVSYVSGEKKLSALTTDYDGTGVVVGVIDMGIDFNHVAFLDSEGKTRIKEAITFSSESNTPIVTTGDAIASLETGNTSSSHGTHTSITAGGSLVTLGGDSTNRGMAPGADLVLCDCSTSLSDAHIIASAKEIFRYAESVQKPAVINCSLGANAGFHDGTEAVPTVFDSLTSAKAGRIIAVSSSNAGARKIGVQKTLNKDEVLQTVLRAENTALYDGEKTVSQYIKGIYGFIYSRDGNPFTVEFKAVDITTGDTYSLSEKPLTWGTAISLNTTVEKYENGQYGLEFYSNYACHFTEPNLHLGVFITAGADNQKIVFTENNAANNASISLVGATSYPDVLAGYTEGDAEMSINTMACTDGVISVGSYMDRANWKSINGGYYHAVGYELYPVGSIAPYSSYGVDDNGTARPDVVATGTYIVSGYNAYDDTYFSGDDINNRVPKDADAIVKTTNVIKGTGIGNGQRPYFYGSMSGTSMSTPVTTGVIALWLQKDPTLTVARVRQLIQQSSIQDKFTVIEANTPAKNLVQAGKGKLDALRGIEILENAGREEENKIPIDQSYTMSANGIATFSSENMLDFRNPHGIKAYYATFDGTTVTFHRLLDRVPANTGLLITATPGTYSIPYAPTATALSDNNMLRPGSDVESYQSSDYQHFVLSKQGDVVGFYPSSDYTDEASFTAAFSGKAYLILPKEQVPGVRGVALSYDESTPSQPDTEGIGLPENEVLEGELIVGDRETGIEQPKAQSIQMATIYDLSGRKVTTPRKGLYIMGGRKVLFE